MSYIYSCKLYKAHSDKERINSAILSPVNTELIRQIDDLEVVEKDDGVETSTPDNSLSFDSFQEPDIEDTDHTEVEDSFDEDVELDESLDDFSDIDETAEELEGVGDEETVDAPEFTTESVQSFLEDNQDTAGVSRTVIKDNELWIHYNDKINLNNIMEAVIHNITEEYPQTEFNRLARTENAIVFVVEDEKLDTDDNISDESSSGFDDFVDEK